MNALNALYDKAFSERSEDFFAAQRRESIGIFQAVGKVFGLFRQPDKHFVLIVALPRTPIYGSHPLKCAEHFRRAKSGVLGYYPVRPHWGPEWGENWDWCDSMPAPELAEPTSLVRNMGYLIRPLRGHLPLKGKAEG